MRDGVGGNHLQHHLFPKKPATVKREAEGEDAGVDGAVAARSLDDRHHHLSASPLSPLSSAAAEGSPSAERGEQEEALAALVEFRSKEVERLRQRLEYYKHQVEEAERKLRDSQSQLARLRSQAGASPLSLESPLDSKGTSKSVVNGSVAVKEEKSSPIRCVKEESYQLRPQTSSAVHPAAQQQQTQSRPPLIIPAVRPKPVPPSATDVKMVGRAGRTEVIGAATSASVRASASPSGSVVGASPSRSSKPEEIVNRLKRGAQGTPSPDKGREMKISKSKSVQKEHTDLISSVRRTSCPSLIRFQSGVHISSQHKRKLRCLEISTTNDQLFVTSALDGVVNLWQLQSRGSSASLLSTTDCLSPSQRRWPEDIAWHPDGDSLIAVYTADGGDAQISVLNLNSSTKRVTFLREKPHVKGIINSLQFIPSADLCFVTGGSDHAVILWHEGDGENEWKPKAVHRNLHTSAVMGVAGLQQKKVVLSVGADKRIVGFDLLASRADFKHQIETKCMSVLPNPSDFNLFMVQSGAPGKQLRLFDIRLRQTELHSFGWKQESSESQSALINQAWSPDGLYITSGSADPMIHIFDIRYNSHNPSQSVQAHQKRVFKAAWHQSLPFLISISSDLNIGLHKIV